MLAFSAIRISRPAFSAVAFRPLSRKPFSSKSGGSKHVENAVAKESSKSEVPSTKKDISSSLDHWRKELNILAGRESNSIRASLDTQFSLPNSVGHNWIQKSDYVITEMKESSGIQLVRTTKVADVKVSFDPTYESDEQQQQQQLQERDQEDSESDRSDSDAEETNENGEAARAVPFEAEIIFKDKEGNPKGSVIFDGEVGVDCRVYVNVLQAVPGVIEKRENLDSVPTAEFDELGQDLQDRLYDLLDEVGVDDKMGSYIRYFCDTYQGKQSIRVLDNLQKILS